MRFPAQLRVSSCLPCGWREPVVPGRGSAPCCPNCGGKLEHFDTTIVARAEFRGIPREGARSPRFERPRLVIGTPA